MFQNEVPIKKLLLLFMINDVLCYIFMDVDFFFAVRFLLTTTRITTLIQINFEIHSTKLTFFLLKHKFIFQVRLFPHTFFGINHLTINILNTGFKF